MVLGQLKVTIPTKGTGLKIPPMTRVIRTLSIVALSLALATTPAAAQSVAQRQPETAQRTVDKGTVVLSEHEGTLVWRSGDDKAFTLWTLANYVSPIVWFSPDEPLLRAGARLPQPLPPLKGTNPTTAPSRVYYNIPLVLIHDTPRCAPLVDKRYAARDHPLADESLVWNDEPGAPVTIDYPPLDCLNLVKIRFFFYYASEVGVSAHFNDFESLQINVKIEPNALISAGPPVVNQCTTTLAESGHCAFVTGAFGSAHGIAWYTNGLDVSNNRDTLLPLSVLVEEGKHASAPDRNGDGIYTPGFDVDIHPNDAWGIRDILRTRWLQGPAFRADMAKHRLEKDRVFPPVPNWRIAETWAVRTIPGAVSDPGKAAAAAFSASAYDLVSMRQAVAGVDDQGQELKYCGGSSDQLAEAIRKIEPKPGCDGGACEPLEVLIRGEEGCRRTRVFPLEGWQKLRQKLAKVSIGGTHDEYLTWARFFSERIAPGFRLSGTSRSGWWIPPVAWNVPGLDGWLSARWNFWRTPSENSPVEGPIDVLYSLSAARYFSSYIAVGRDTLPLSDVEAPGGRRTALEAGFKWRFSIPKIDVFSGVRVGLRADDLSHLRYPRVVVEFGGGSW